MASALQRASQFFGEAVLTITRAELESPGDGPPPRPFANSYWLIPGRVLAGEHPQGGHREALALRLAGLQAAGVSCCIDLTGAADGPNAYAPLPLAARPARREAHAIADFGLPSVQRMRQVLDAMAKALVAGEVVYLHCHAGIGRTGTVAGCFLIEQGAAPAEALPLLQHKWRAMAKSAFVRETPETLAQRDFVAAWVAGTGC